VIVLDALMDLGYNVQLVGEDLKLTYTRDGTPDPAQITPLLEAIRLHKGEAVEYLKRQASFERMFKNAMGDIDGAYQAGTISHIKENYPILWGRLVEAEEKLSAAWLSGKDDEFKAQLNGWTLLNFQAIKIFEKRDTQDQLFGDKEKEGAKHQQAEGGSA
jgi:hypothetical protein